MLRRRQSPPPPDGSEFTGAAARAVEAWRQMADEVLVRRGGNHVLVMDRPGHHAQIAAVWPLGQVLAAALDLARLVPGSTPVADLAETVELYRRGDGYAPYPMAGERYVDDNAWLGLDFVQAHLQEHPGRDDSLWLHRAKRTFEVVVANQDADGGIRWLEGNPSRNTCSTAPGIELALRLHLVSGIARYREVAERADAWLWSTLADDEGLLWDNVDGHGRVERTIWAYNQGTPVGADVLWFRLTGDRARLDRATRTTAVALEHFEADDRLWRQPPAFVAIFFRNLLTLHAAEPQPRVVATLDRYLERVWREARDPRTGRFTGGGIGHYDDGETLDHAAVVQLFSLQAFPPEWLPDVA